MKFNKILIALTLCAAMQPNVSFGSQRSQNESYWQRTKNYAARAKNYAASWVPGSVKNVSAVAADRMDDFFQPSVIRQFKRAVRAYYKKEKETYDRLLVEHDRKKQIELISNFARYAQQLFDNTTYNAVVNRNEINHELEMLYGLTSNEKNRLKRLVTGLYLGFGYY